MWKLSFMKWRSVGEGKIFMTLTCVQPWGAWSQGWSPLFLAFECLFSTLIQDKGLKPQDCANLDKLQANFIEIIQENAQYLYYPTTLTIPPFGREGCLTSLLGYDPNAMKGYLKGLQGNSLIYGILHIFDEYSWNIPKML